MPVDNKEGAIRALREDWDNYFLTQNLESVSSLKHLAEKMDKMRDDVYVYHVGPTHNHFSRWIKDVFGDDYLASEISSVDRRNASQILKKRIEELEKMANSL